jgi:hypothetical protein
VIDSRKRAEPLRQAFNFNHRLTHKQKDWGNSTVD